MPSPQEGGSQGLGVRGGVAFSSQSSHGGRWVRRVLCWPGPAGGHPAGRSLLHVSRPASRRSRVALTLEGCRHRGQQLVTTSRRTCREPQRWGEGWAGGPFQRPGVGPLTKKGVYLTGTPPPGGAQSYFGAWENVESHTVPPLALLRQSGSWGASTFGGYGGGSGLVPEHRFPERGREARPAKSQAVSTLQPPSLPSPPLPKPLSESDKGSPVPGKDAHRPREGIPEDSMHDSSPSLLGSLEVFFP